MTIGLIKEKTNCMRIDIRRFLLEQKAKVVKRHL